MRKMVVALLLATGCAEHGSSPDARGVDGKIFADAEVTRCASADGSANIAASSGSLRRIYAAGITPGLVAPPARVHSEFTVSLLFTNVPEADGIVLQRCVDDTAHCSIDGIYVITTSSVISGSAIGPHRVRISSVPGDTSVLDGSIEISEYVDPFVDQPGHITGTISGVSPTLSVSGPFSTAFCPPMFVFPI